jgi:hydroxymethylpyrimidine pyrophosphatase-like HAD family hydrolase
MIYCFDLDGTICTNTNGLYENAEPFYERIKIINNLFEEGNKIIINTARGYTTGIDWTELTIKQLKDWNLNYHELYVGKKINADLYVDDKGITDKDFFKKY